MAESKPLRPTKSSRALKQILKEGRELAVVLEKEIHRTLLWKYARGQVRPGIEHALYIEAETMGVVSVAGWSEKRARKRAA